VRRALLALPEQQRKAALARYVEDLPPAEIDRRYGWKPNTAHVYLSLARKAIRRRLAGAGGHRGAAAPGTRSGGGEEAGSTER
jgi:DNA-directed RNA polymerase specialized sigma24 family protein